MIPLHLQDRQLFINDNIYIENIFKTNNQFKNYIRHIKKKMKRIMEKIYFYSLIEEQIL